MAEKTRKVDWRRLLLLIPRLVAIVFLGRLLIDWSASSMPVYAGLAHDVAGIVVVWLLVVFVMGPGLEACGEKIDPSTRHQVTSVRWVCGFALLSTFLLGLNRLRYFLEIDADPWLNRLWNILIGLAVVAGYGIMVYLDRRKTSTK